jgi:hypothetical protein
MIHRAGGEEKVLAAFPVYDNIDNVPIQDITSLAQRQGMIDAAGGEEKVLAAFPVYDNIDDVPIQDITSMAQRQGMIDRAGGRVKVLAAFTAYDNIDDVPIQDITSLAQRQGMIDRAGGKEKVLAAFPGMEIEKIPINTLKLCCAVGGVNKMKASLGVDSLVGISIDRLEEQTTFWKLFNELVAFEEANGHLCVPTTYEENQPLANWVRNIHLCNISLTDRRMKLLNSIGFVWNAHDAAWEERFNELVKFKAKNGHTNVPQPKKKDPEIHIREKA